ncbi:MAG TPA: DUF998 domain-containing protein [Streptosporangiaceae bacterium]
MASVHAAARQTRQRLADASESMVRAGLALPRWVLLTAGLAPAVLTGGWLTAGMLQPTPYDPVRQTISVLAGSEGNYPWIMTGALYLTCGLYIVTAAGLAQLRPSARLLLVLAGLCSAGIASAPEPAGGPTTVHIAWTVIGGVTIAVWPAVAGRVGDSAPVIVRAPGAVIITVLFVALLGWVLWETQGGNDLGLAERLASSVQTTWPFVVAVSLRRATSSHQVDDEVTDGPASREDGFRRGDRAQPAQPRVPRQVGRADQPAQAGQRALPRGSGDSLAARRSSDSAPPTGLAEQSGPVVPSGRAPAGGSAAASGPAGAAGQEAAESPDGPAG